MQIFCPSAKDLGRRRAAVFSFFFFFPFFVLMTKGFCTFRRPICKLRYVMSQSEEKYAELAVKWVDKNISPEERQEFNDWYQRDQDQPLVITAKFAADRQMHKERIYEKVLAGMEDRSVPEERKLWKPVAVAVSVVAVLSVALYFYLQPARHFDLEQLAKEYGHGKNIAVLTDQDGRQFLLEDSIFNMKAEAGRFGLGSGNGLVKIETPRGSHHQVLLEDGTKVWLGAASSMNWAVEFPGNTRNIRLSGAAYFEVAHHPEKPFQVKVVNKKKALDIVVLGTKFNVSAYPEDPEIKTHVFEGVVKLSSGSQSTLLTRNEQVSFRNGIFGAKEVKIDEGWMRFGALYFDNDDVYQVMRVIAREYNAELEYHKVPGERMHLTGIISRRTSLKEFLHIIEVATDYKFSLEGKRVIVFENNDHRY
jgi:ferric-dicitrate binding protein FerR (iron transport regulator)